MKPMLGLAGMSLLWSALAADADDADDGEVAAPVAAGPKLVVAGAELGGSKISAGGLDVPLQPALALSAGYPIAVKPELRVDVGVALGLTSIPYTSSVTNQ